ncbi:hypothetical protein D3C87_1516280 [compost metagenome]
MSVIFDVADDLSNIPEILDKYEDALVGHENHLKIKGKNLESANVENPSWMAYYDQRKIELNSLARFIEMKLEQEKGKLWKAYTEAYSRELSARDKDQYISKDPSYLKVYQVLIIIEELLKKYSSVVDAFQNRGYALRNITSLRVASMEDVVL